MNRQVSLCVMAKCAQQSDTSQNIYSSPEITFFQYPPTSTGTQDVLINTLWKVTYEHPLSAVEPS